MSSHQLNSDVTGQLSLYFINKDTQAPVTDFPQYDTNIERDSVQIMFVSSDGKVSFKTSLFTSNYYVSTSSNFLFPNPHIDVHIRLYYYLSISSCLSDSRPCIMAL